MNAKSTIIYWWNDQLYKCQKKRRRKKDFSWQVSCVEYVVFRIFFSLFFSFLFFSITIASINFMTKKRRGSMRNDEYHEWHKAVTFYSMKVSFFYFFFSFSTLRRIVTSLLLLFLFFPSSFDLTFIPFFSSFLFDVLIGSIFVKANF